MPETSNCPGCGDTIDVDDNKVEIEKLKGTLESLRENMVAETEKVSSIETYNKTTEAWTKYTYRYFLVMLIIYYIFRLQKLVRHPYRLLYTAEQLFWKALRLSHGNSSK